jgi:oxygen-independent coproporphyrinogen-3 oxidase
METYFEVVVERLTKAEYRWYETANFCRAPSRAGGRDLRSHHNLAYWRGRDYLGVGIGAVSTIDGTRWTNAPRLAPYIVALGRGEPPQRSHEPLSDETRARERVMLGLRLDEPLELDGFSDAVDTDALARMERLGLARVRQASRGALRIALTPRGRLLGGGVTAEILA